MALLDSYQETRKGRLLLLSTALLFSTGGAAIKGTILSAWQIAGLRSAIAATLLWLWAGRQINLRDWRIWPVAIAYAATMVTFVAATKLTTAAAAIFLQSTAPVYVLILSPLLLKERPRRIDLIAGSVIAAGLLMLVASNEGSATAPNPALGNLLAALSGFAWACNLTGLRWVQRSPVHGLSPVVAGNATVAIAACFLGIWPQEASAQDWAIIAYLGVFQVALAYATLSAGLRRVPAVEASLLLMLEPVLNATWAWLIHHEQPGPFTLAGGACIVVATVLRTMLGTRRGAPAATANAADSAADSPDRPQSSIR